MICPADTLQHALAQHVHISSVRNNYGYISKIQKICANCNVLAPIFGGLLVGDGWICVVGLGMHGPGGIVLHACTINLSRMAARPLKSSTKK